ncbi:MAG: hypothetical protein LUD17_02570 [Bacteroidales bacterium]|nr:hypothetical protein [Bacteroidales bacterium]
MGIVIALGVGIGLIDLGGDTLVEGPGVVLEVVEVNHTIGDARGMGIGDGSACCWRAQQPCEEEENF